MHYLNAALAFAVTMFVLSVMTGVVVETIHRLWGLREKGLARMIGHFYDRVIAGYLPDSSSRQAFIEAMTVNQAPAAGEQPAVANAKSKDSDFGFLSNLIDGRRLKSLSVTEFMTRLGSMDLGLGGGQAGTAQITTILEDIERKYQQFSDEVTLYFEKRARLLSVLSAMAIAVVLYVNPVQLWQKYSADEKTAVEVIKLMNEAEKSWKEGQAAAADNALKELIEAKNRLVTEVGTLTKAGAPLGWPEERKKCLLGSSEINNCNYQGLFSDLVLLIFGGLLIGLGAPFWHDTFKSLSGLKELLAGVFGKDQTGLKSSFAPASQASEAQSAFVAAQQARAVKASIATDKNNPQ